METRREDDTGSIEEIACARCDVTIRRDAAHRTILTINEHGTETAMKWQVRVRGPGLLIRMDQRSDAATVRQERENGPITEVSAREITLEVRRTGRSAYAAWMADHLDIQGEGGATSMTIRSEQPERLQLVEM